ncbi:MAG: hypothetical protein KIT81_17370 [Alphaproteobacteria bacterium]|nr:hypothetical protein [Alphaproteobacteria bacterium]
MRRKLLLCLVLLGLALPQLACGKKGDLQAPEGASAKDSDVKLRRYK